MERQSQIEYLRASTTSSFPKRPEILDSVMNPSGRARSLVSGVVRVLDLLVDAAAIGDVVVVLLRPGTDLGCVRIGAGAGGLRSGAAGGTLRRATLDATGQVLTWNFRAGEKPGLE